MAAGRQWPRLSCQGVAMPMFDLPVAEVPEVDLDADLASVPALICDRCTQGTAGRTFDTYAELSDHRDHSHRAMRPDELKPPEDITFEISEAHTNTNYDNCAPYVTYIFFEAT